MLETAVYVDFRTKTCSERGRKKMTPASTQQRTKRNLRRSQPDKLSSLFSMPWLYWNRKNKEETIRMIEPICTLYTWLPLTVLHCLIPATLENGIILAYYNFGEDALSSILKLFLLSFLMSLSGRVAIFFSVPYWTKPLRAFSGNQIYLA